MKFGKIIGAQQDEHGELHYVGYKVLKKKIKMVCEQLEVHDLAEALSANTAFEEELKSEIRQVNDCFERLHGKLLFRISDLSEQLQQSKPIDSLLGSTGTMAVAPHFMKQLVILLGEVDRLRRYAVWNAAAVVKILKKRRKQTNFGLEDDSAERVGWLSRQSFFSGSDFAELHVALESLGSAILVSQIRGSGIADGQTSSKAEQQAVGHCPICLDPLVDTVELECKHRFCWKCFVLGPIASQPGQYRITTCPVCRRQTSLESSGTGGDEHMEDALHGAHSALSRFLRTYFKEEWDQLDRDRTEELPQLGEDGEGLDLKHAIGDLMKVVQADNSWPQQRKVRGLAGDVPAIESGGAEGSAAPAAASESSTALVIHHAGEGASAAATASTAAGSEGSRGVPRDFLHTLPTPQPKDEQQMRAAQKMQWLQIASVGDPLVFCHEMNCLLCSEPLHTEEFVTTPCKHHFHRVCIMRLDMPSCPLCSTALPFSWFLPAEHPLAEAGFKIIEAQRYRPICPGGPSRGSGGYPLHSPPPTHLYGRRGMMMRSYLHKLPPMGGEDDDDPVKSPRDRCETPLQTPQGAPFWGSVLPASAGAEELDSGGSGDLSSGSASGSSSEDSGSEEDRRPIRWAFSAAGKMRLLSRNSKLSGSPRPMPAAAAASRGPAASGSSASAAALGGQGAACSTEDDALARGSGSSSAFADWQRQQQPVVLRIGNHV